ncbi:MAG TPA: anti-sigma factor [Candidatus Eisenbacteria bacterium]|nr:anti-sigma factor [Candidatus Eisenbacteria bacterium]
MRDDEPIGVDERELDDLALEALAEAHARRAPAPLRERLVGAVRTEAQIAGTRRALTRWRMVGALAASVAVVATGLLARELRYAQGQSAQIAGLATANADLERRLDEQGKTLVGLREALDAQTEILRVIGGPRTLTAQLAPKEGFAGSGRVLVDQESGEAHIVLAGLPPAGAGKTYELWAIRGDHPPEPAGLLRVAGGVAVATRLERVKAPGDVSAFAVSIEPEQGSTSPTGPIVLVGKLT